MQMGGRDPNDKPNRLADWGNSLLNKLPSLSRKRRKRVVDKARRQAERRALSLGDEEQVPGPNFQGE